MFKSDPYPNPGSIRYFEYQLNRAQPSENWFHVQRSGMEEVGRLSIAYESSLVQLAKVQDELDLVKEALKGAAPSEETTEPPINTYRILPYTE